MKGVLKALGLLLLAGGVLYWVAAAMPPLPELSRIDADRQLASPLPVSSEEGPATLEGVAIYQGDTPFIEYHLETGEVRTKQLRFESVRTCNPSAGDLPCVPGRSGTEPRPPYGARIGVTGTIVGDQILVRRLEYR